MLTFEIASDFIGYDVATGKLSWRDRTFEMYVKHFLAHRGVPNLDDWNDRNAGKPAFATLQKNGKTAGDFFGQRYRADSVVWLFHEKKWRDGPIFHLNGNNSDNHISNLSRRKPGINSIRRMQDGLRPTDCLVRFGDDIWVERDGALLQKVRPFHGEKMMKSLADTLDMAVRT
jgi:hypothetical protein